MGLFFLTSLDPRQDGHHTDDNTKHKIGGNEELVKAATVQLREDKTTHQECTLVICYLSKVHIEKDGCCNRDQVEDTGEDNET